jgi:hypothetical protein
MNIYDVPELQKYLNPQGIDPRSFQSIFPMGVPFNPRSIQSIFPTNVQRGITASSAAIPFGSPVDIAQGFTQNTPSDQGTNFQFLPSANEANETDEVKETNTGIAKLFDFLSNFIPGVGLLKRLSDSGGIRSLNQRLRNTDFARSRTGAEYFQRREARKEAERLAPIERQLREASERSGGYQPTTQKQNVSRTASRRTDKGVGQGGVYGL